jgi:hypothetical protein
MLCLKSTHNYIKIKFEFVFLVSIEGFSKNSCRVNCLQKNSGIVLYKNIHYNSAKIKSVFMYSTSIIRILLIPLFISIQLWGMQKEMVTHDMPNMFNILPVEMLEKVAKRLDARSLEMFVDTCKDFRNVAFYNHHVIKAVNRRGGYVNIKGSKAFYNLNEELMDRCLGGTYCMEGAGVEMLLKNKRADLEYRTPFCKLYGTQTSLQGYSLLGAACSGLIGPVKLNVVECLLKKGAKPKKHGIDSALQTVVRSQTLPLDTQIELIKLMSMYDANLYRLNMQNDTILHLAAAHNPRLLPYLLANSTIPVDTVDSLCQTPLTAFMCCAIFSEIESQEFKIYLDAFAEKHADPHVKDRFGRSAYQYARLIIQDQIAHPDLVRWVQQQKKPVEHNQIQEVGSWFSNINYLRRFLIGGAMHFTANFSDCSILDRAVALQR